MHCTLREAGSYSTGFLFKIPPGKRNFSWIPETVASWSSYCLREIYKAHQNWLKIPCTAWAFPDGTYNNTKRIICCGEPIFPVMKCLCDQQLSRRCTYKDHVETRAGEAAQDQCAGTSLHIFLIRSLGIFLWSCKQPWIAIKQGMYLHLWSTLKS